MNLLPQEVLAAVLEPVLFLVKECTHAEYCELVLPALRPVFTNPGKSIQASAERPESMPYQLPSILGIKCTKQAIGCTMRIVVERLKKRTY